MDALGVLLIGVLCGLAVGTVIGGAVSCPAALVIAVLIFAGAVLVTLLISVYADPVIDRFIAALKGEKKEGEECRKK